MIPMFERARAPAVALAVLLAAGTVLPAGCSPTLDNNGNIPLAEAIEAIKPGKQNRDQVASMLGSPSTQATFQRDQIWYYIGKRTKSLAFFSPTVVEHKVVEIRFDSAGIVKEVRLHDAKAAKKIELVDRKTPTKGNDLTFVEQLIGNLGRFNPAGGSNSDSLSGPAPGR